MKNWVLKVLSTIGDLHQNEKVFIKIGGIFLIFIAIILIKSGKRDMWRARNLFGSNLGLVKNIFSKKMKFTNVILPTFIAGAALKRPATYESIEKRFFNINQ